jgi:hypothetical protein
MSRLHHAAAASCAAAVLSLPAAAAAQSPDQIGQWGPVMDFHAPATHQVLLHDGEVLYWRTGQEAELFDPATSQLTPVPAPFPIPGFNIHCDGMAVLPDGRVLALGGQVDSPHQAVSMAAIFDPATRTWTQIPSMHNPRWYPTAVSLADGRVAVVGGESATRDPANPNALLPTTQVEIYDPQTNTWTVVPGAERAEDLYAPNYLLPDGDIFNATPNSPDPVNKATPGLDSGLLNLASGTWSAGPPAHYRTIGYSESFAMYRPGKVIRAGGTITNQAATSTATNRAETIDMTAPSPAWQATAPMAFPRRRENMVILADGTVMAVGGTQQGDDPQQAVLAGEIWNPDTGTWTTVASMRDSRMYHSAALLLPDGRVLSAGGEPSTANIGFQNNQPAPPAQTAQIYSPPYLFKGPRPAIAAAPSRVGYATAFSISTPDAASIDSVALIRPSAVTHANNMAESYVPLQFTKGSGSLSAISPPNGNWAPPGWYMLVIKNAAGVPSVARWVQIGSGPLLDDPGFHPDTGTGGGGGSSSTGAGGGSGGGGGAQSAHANTLSVAPRTHLRTLRTRGLRLTLDIGSPLRGSRPVLRVRVLKLGARRHARPLATFFRAAPRQGKVSVVLRSVVFRHLRPGRYEIVAAVGGSRASLGRALVKRFTVTR